MHFLDFQNLFSAYPLFSLKEVRKTLSRFSYRQLDRWEKKGYLIKLKRGFYCFSDHENQRNFLLYVANKIYAPSYISLQLALKIHGLIPEEVFQITSVGTKKTTSFVTPVGQFSYKHIQPRLYFGYTLVSWEGHQILLAEPEKAILDYLYLNPALKSPEDFLGMRMDTEMFKTRVNQEKFHRYLEVFRSRALAKRAEVFWHTYS